VDTKACKFGGTPMYITGISGSGHIADVVGTAADYPGIGT